MDKQELQALIDRVIGTKGIMRSSAWWVRKIFNEVIKYNEADASTKSYKAFSSAKEYVDKAVSEVEITVDSAMSSSSTNPVQNRVVKSFIEMPIKTLNIIGGNVSFDSRTYYKFGELLEPLIITLNNASGVGMYMFEFEVGSNSIYVNEFDIILPEGVNWANGVSPIFDPGIKYQVTITNGVAEIKGNRKSVRDYAKDLNVKELTFIALEDGWSISVPRDMEYSIDGESWQFISKDTYTPAIDKWQYVSFRCSIEKGEQLRHMTASKICYVTGSVMSLVHSSNYELYYTLEGYDYAFDYLFSGEYGGSHYILGVDDDLLPATILAKGCYRSMFNNGVILRNAPKLPATHLADECYDSMFSQCALRTAPELPAKSLGKWCYNSMFHRCNYLTAMPLLLATDLTVGCYQNMFSQCSNLVRAGFLPATYGEDTCYRGMFQDCISLSKAPNISLNRLAYQSLFLMFSGCTNLVKPADITVSELAEDYGQACAAMYANCSSMEYGPIIKTPAISVPSAFANMYTGCSKLKYIIFNAPSIPRSGFTGWVDGVADSGVIFKHPDITLPVGANGSPDGWEVKYIKDMYLTMEALENGMYASLSNTNCEYSLDGIEWTALPAGESTPSINAGKTISFRCKSPTIKSNAGGIGTFTVNKGFALRGNVMSILYGDNAYKTEKINESLYSLFAKATTLRSVAADFLPAKRIDAWRAYQSMFNGCTSLVNAPDLPGTIIPENDNCYESMFKGCTSLIAAPSLPSSTLGRYCYRSMFEGCTALTEAPELLAASLPTNAYERMFYGCSNLSYVKMLASNYRNGTYQMMVNTATAGTFVANAKVDVSDLRSRAYIPEGWTIETISV